MRILHFSDLHIDKNADILYIDKSILKNSFIKYIQLIENTFDILLITGDLTNNMFYNISFLKELELYIPNKIIKYVPGNHDMSSILITTGNDIKPFEANQLYDYYLNTKYSLKEPFHINENTVLIGGLGWYDYSYVDEFLKDIKDEKEKEKFLTYHKSTHWFDGRKIKFKETDKALTHKENKRYEELFKEYKNKDIFLMNHFIPFERYITWKTNDTNWNVANAYMGSSSLGDLIEKYKNIKYVAFGHTHNRHGKVIIGERTEICSPLGYVGEWVNFVDYTYSLNEILENFIEECQLSKVYIEI